MYVLGFAANKNFCSAVLVCSRSASTSRRMPAARHHLRRAEGDDRRGVPAPVAAAADACRASRSRSRTTSRSAPSPPSRRPTSVQPSSMIRFANALGFDGFSQMQQVFQSHLVERSAPYRERIRADAARRRRAATGGVLPQFVGEAIGELQPARGARRCRAARRRGEASSRARRRSTCSRSGARFRSPATSPTRWTSSSCSAPARRPRRHARRVRAHDPRRRRAARRQLSQLHAGGRRDRARQPRRGVSVIAITDSALSPLKPRAPTSASSSATTRRGRSARWSRRSAWRRRWSSAPATASPPAPTGGAPARRRRRRARRQ